MSAPSKQELFDKIVAGLASQGFERSLAKDGVHCRYRGENGRKCAVGHLIPDERYSAACEGFGVTRRAVTEALGLGVFEAFHGDWVKDNDERMLGFLSHCQCAHDEGDTPEHMRDALRGVAHEFELTIPDALKEVPNAAQ